MIKQELDFDFKPYPIICPKGHPVVRVKEWAEKSWLKRFFSSGDLLFLDGVKCEKCEWQDIKRVWISGEC